jgi:hypothetical protein
MRAMRGFGDRDKYTQTDISDLEKKYKNAKIRAITLWAGAVASFSLFGYVGQANYDQTAADKLSARQSQIEQTLSPQQENYIDLINDNESVFAGITGNNQDELRQVSVKLSNESKLDETVNASAELASIEKQTTDLENQGFLKGLPFLIGSFALVGFGTKSLFTTVETRSELRKRKSK